MSAVLPSAAGADAGYPDKPIRLVVPFAPGGGADYSARRFAQPLSEALKQPIIIDNVPGAGGSMGANKVAKAAPDGYTLLYTTPGQQMTAPYLIENLPYDAFKDLRPVSQLTAGTNVLVVNKDFPARSVRELIDHVKKNPGTVNFASSGIGSTSHLAGELFKKMAGVDIVHVPYRGSAIAAADVIGGRVEMSIDTLSVYLPHIQSGAVRALGVSTLEPNPIIPDVPPIAKTLDGFEASPVNYISAPGGTPEPIIKKLSEAIIAVAEDPALRANFASTGSRLAGSTPAEMEALVRSEQKRWKEVIDSAGIAVTNAK
ncbi:tripartite tricarboxylate transporter substrate binding protein [Parapusillimonas granuli]|uniref:Tripartite tricarboxylate transporter substrate binding protein n=2 Tax=Parapusillimonas granuli TaxID=380911 RepID=A0A853G149_9BURK|nr:tripartite tricarboxylate transporter substrate binding protein [Parapusillimonas granuli]